MIYRTALIKLLGIPKKVVEPTPYHLLGLDPKACTPEQVKNALRERKKSLRQNIPGPQFIPVIHQLEKELDAAAELLIDPEKREAYHERVRREYRERKQKKLRAQRKVIVRAVNNLIRKAVNEDGTLGRDKRSSLAEQIRKLGISEEQIQRILSQIPEPVSQGETTATACDYFAIAVGSAIRNNALAENDEKRLIETAVRLGLSEQTAIEIINECLKAHKAKRGQPPAEVLEAEFEKEILELCPGGRAVGETRKVLLRLALRKGLSDKQAKKVIDRCVSADEDATAPTTLPEIASESPVESPTEMEDDNELIEALELAPEGGRHYTLMKALGLGIPLASIMIFLLLVIKYGEEPPRA